MIKQNLKQSRGFTLVELLLVLLVISAFLFAGRTIYQRYVLRKEIAVVEQDLQLLFDKLDDSYYQLTDDEKQSCSSKINTSIISDWSEILHSSLVSDVSSETPPHPDFRLSCVNPASDQPAQLVIEAPLTINSTDTNKLEWYARRLGGYLDGTNVKWAKIPTYMFAGKDPYWILDPRLGQLKSMMTIHRDTLTFNLTSSSSSGSLYIPTQSLIVTISYFDGSEEKTVKLSSSTLYDNKTTSSKLQTIGNKTIKISGINVACANPAGKVILSHDAIGDVALTNKSLTVNVSLVYSTTSGSTYEPSSYLKAQYSDSSGTSAGLSPSSVDLDTTGCDNLYD